MALNNKWKKSRFVLLLSQSTRLLFHKDVGDDYCECFSLKVIVWEAFVLTKDVVCMQMAWVDLPSNNEWDLLGVLSYV